MRRIFVLAMALVLSACSGSEVSSGGGLAEGEPPPAIPLAEPATTTTITPTTSSTTTVPIESASDAEIGPNGEVIDPPPLGETKTGAGQGTRTAPAVDTIDAPDVDTPFEVEPPVDGFGQGPDVDIDSRTPEDSGLPEPEPLAGPLIDALLVGADLGASWEQEPWDSELSVNSLSAEDPAECGQVVALNALNNIARTQRVFDMRDESRRTVAEVSQFIGRGPDSETVTGLVNEAAELAPCVAELLGSDDAISMTALNIEGADAAVQWTFAVEGETGVLLLLAVDDVLTVLTEERPDIDWVVTPSLAELAVDKIRSVS